VKTLLCTVARAARPAIARRTDDILVIYGDTPLITPATSPTVKTKM